MTLAVSDKCIPEWLSISRSLQEWGLVYWEAACLVWSTESCALESKSHQQLDRCMAATVWAADITVIVLCTIHFHPWLHEKHTNAPCLQTPTETETQEHVYQKPARYVNELKWHLIEIWSANSRASLINWQISGKIVLLRVSKPKANTLNICYDVFLYEM